MKRIYFFILFAVMALQSHAQITEFPYNEGFEGLPFPPSGWIGYPIVTGDMEFVRVTEGEWPECMPHDGSTAMAQYNSFNASVGEQAVLISPEMILTDDNVLRFWFFRSEDPSNNRHDKLEVYYNTTPNLTGATFLDSINRAINFYPNVSFEGWYQYEFQFNNPGSTYIIFKAISAYGWKMYLDDIEVNTNSIDEDP
ncbi:MAG: choice-of-anchor J domain-containing protein, partial [Bacteroidales bacterium]|nr:choice-of-anchor J domain-containing protein [Bacteroidales bacterium]